MNSPIELPECVKMKHRIQEQIMADTAGMSDDERHQHSLDVINSDPVLGPFYREIIAAGRVITPAPRAAHAAEAAASYEAPSTPARQTPA